MFRKRAKYTSYYDKQRGKKNLLFAVAVFFSLFVLFYILHYFAFAMFSVKSAAMQPALLQGERFVASRFYFVSASKTDDSKRGDIVLLRLENESKLSFPFRVANAIVSFVTFQRLKPFGASELLGDLTVARRLLGFPGDTIYMEDFVLYIKPASSGHFLTEFEIVPSSIEYSIISSPFPENWHDPLPFSGNFAPIELKENEFFVIGDNRVAINDSRTWGVVASKNIKGKAIFRYWPPLKMGKIN